jgi:metal-responsive CopG/Arc/MetJ family transcriptional regulator
MKISEIVMFRLPLVECQKLAKTAREEHFETRSHVIREAIAEYLAKKES